MTATIFFPLYLDLHQPQEKSVFSNTHSFQPLQKLSFTLTTPKPSHPFLPLRKFNRFNFTPSSSPSHSSSTDSSTEPYLIDQVKTGGFLTTQDLEKFQILENFRYFHEFESGSLCIRLMREDEMDSTVGLLSESFGESMSLPFKYVNVLGYLIKQYMIQRRALMPHTATLIGFYREGDEEEELAGTVEISFNKKGANVSPPTPTPPKKSPYICNMTVKKPLRRRGIGWHLLKAAEELIFQMNTTNEVYLHCRIIDAAPFNMYSKAGYNIIKTDNILILLTLQRRKHLMYKKLPVANNKSELDISSLDNSLASKSYENNVVPNSKSESDISSLDNNPASTSYENNVASNSKSESDLSSLDNNPASKSYENNVVSNSKSESDLSSLDNNPASKSYENNVVSNSKSEQDISSLDNNPASKSYENNVVSNSKSESNISSFSYNLNSKSTSESDISSYDDNVAWDSSSTSE